MHYACRLGLHICSVVLPVSKSFLKQVFQQLELLCFDCPDYKTWPGTGACCNQQRMLIEHKTHSCRQPEDRIQYWQIMDEGQALCGQIKHLRLCQCTRMLVSWLAVMMASRSWEYTMANTLLSCRGISSATLHHAVLFCFFPQHLICCIHVMHCIMAIAAEC